MGLKPRTDVCGTFPAGVKNVFIIFFYSTLRGKEVVTKDFSYKSLYLS